MRTSGNSVFRIATGGQDARRFAHGGAGEEDGRERRRVGRWRRLLGVKPGRRKRPAAAVRRPRGPTNGSQRPAQRSERNTHKRRFKSSPCSLNSSMEFRYDWCRIPDTISTAIFDIPINTHARPRGRQKQNNARKTSSDATGQQSSARKRSKYTGEINTALRTALSSSKAPDTTMPQTGRSTDSIPSSETPPIRSRSTSISTRTVIR